MTYKDQAKTIGKKGTIRVGKTLVVDVKILDYKHSYGRDRWLITPVVGTGEAWVEDVKISS